MTNADLFRVSSGEAILRAVLDIQAKHVSEDEAVRVDWLKLAKKAERSGHRVCKVMAESVLRWCDYPDALLWAKKHAAPATRDANVGQLMVDRCGVFVGTGGVNTRQVPKKPTLDMLDRDPSHWG